jgi:hypothetical protein
MSRREVRYQNKKIIRPNLALLQETDPDLDSSRLGYPTV